MSIALGLLTVVLLTAATGFFVAMEFAYVAVDRSSLADLAERGDAAAARAVRVTDRLSFALSGAQLGITVTALLVGYVSEPLIGTGLADLLGFTGLGEAARLSLALVLALLFSTVVQMVLGELAPKNLAIARTIPLARALGRASLLYLTIAGPVIRLFDGASVRLLRALGIEPVDELSHAATSEELERIVDRSTEAGAVSAELSQLLERGLAFRDRTVREVMTPRVDVHTLPAEATVADLIEATSQGHARFPVLGHDAEDVVGVLGPADVLTVPPPLRETTRLRSLLGTDRTAAVVLPETLPAPVALERLRAEHRQLAVVIDEYGGFAGVISFEDIAEEVVGEILDEDDREAHVPAANADGSWTVPARTRLDELEVLFGVALPEDADFETVGGLILDRLGRTARVGDTVSVPVLADLALAAEPDADTPVAHLHVDQIRRHVPHTVTLRVVEPAQTGQDAEPAGDPAGPAAAAEAAGGDASRANPPHQSETGR